MEPEKELPQEGATANPTAEEAAKKDDEPVSQAKTPADETSATAAEEKTPEESGPPVPVTNEARTSTEVPASNPFSEELASKEESKAAECESQSNEKNPANATEERTNASATEESTPKEQENPTEVPPPMEVEEEEKADETTKEKEDKADSHSELTTSEADESQSQSEPPNKRNRTSPRRNKKEPQNSDQTGEASSKKGDGDGDDDDDAQAKETNGESPATSPTKPTRLYFGRDRLLFTTMAKAYIHHEIYKFDCQERWELAINEFYDKRSTDERKSLIAIKRPFLSGLESRIKALPKKPSDDKTEEQKLCRQIKKLRAEAKKERVRKGQEEPEESKKKRKRTIVNETRGRPRMTDIEMSPDMERRFQVAQKKLDAQRKATDEVQDIERQIVEAQKKLAQAKEHQKAVGAVAEEAAEAFSKDVINGTGPWKDMFEKLKAYATEHGTCNIIRGQTPEMKALRRWVLRQRERYHMKDHQKSKLPWYCAWNLESIGFLWRYSDGTWMKFYNELLEYKKEHGDCAVPRGFKQNPKLSQWVKRMRHEGNRFREDPNSVSMTAHQMKMLEDIGFIWENLSRSWNERFEDLKKFKEEHGHCRVPKVYPANPKLVSWCQNQRAHHRAFLLGKKTFMDAARKQQLEEVGFEWETGATPGRPPSDKKKQKKSRKKKDEEEGSASEEEEEEEEDVETAPMDMDQPMTFPPPPPPAYQTHAFAHPNHAYANPYQHQQPPPVPPPQVQQQQQRHYYPY